MHINSSVIHTDNRYTIVNITRVYKRNSTSIELTNLIEEISRLGSVDVLQKYHNKPLEKKAKSIVAGPSFLQFLNKLFQTQISTGDIIQFESGNSSKYYMLSATGTWDEIINYNDNNGILILEKNKIICN